MPFKLSPSLRVALRQRATHFGNNHRHFDVLLASAFRQNLQSRRGVLHRSLRFSGLLPVDQAVAIFTIRPLSGTPAFAAESCDNLLAASNVSRIAGLDPVGARGRT